MKQLVALSILFTLFVFGACNGSKNENNEQKEELVSEMQKKVDEFASFTLTTDLSKLSEKEKQMLPFLFEAADIMNEIFWIQAYGGKDTLMAGITDEATKKFAEINYGPWERLKDNEPFVSGIETKPLGSNFYPHDMTKEEFEKFEATDKTSLYTMVRRDVKGALITIPYHEFFKEKHQKVADLLLKAAELAEDDGLKKYLELRSKALLTDDYFESDMAWMDMKSNGIDIVIGPIENYEDALFGNKAAHEAFVLIKDKYWSEKLAKYSKLLPELQKGIPAEDKYKQEKPGSNSDLNAYDVVFYAGDCNAGSKTIAINLPNDEKVQLAKGSRRLQLKNAMQAKFDYILLPITNLIVDSSQRKHVKFNSFFENTMFHEVAHGLGIKNTIDRKGTVREALKEQYSALEEGKADILGLYMITKLKEMGELDVDLMDNYVTFMAGIFRSIRFGGASAHGKANLVRYNYFKEKGAFIKNEDGTYTCNFDKMTNAMASLSELILKLQGDGDYDGVVELMKQKAVIGNDLQSDLDNISNAGIPLDIVFKQGLQELGLN
ncbi:MAG: Zn-dependent hydrolase [Bacteroidetes bacterium 4572_117]|nr:MAG: Zn-dependent hydrolase [Bacteroidetes bacterium 4572_117]